MLICQSFKTRSIMISPVLMLKRYMMPRCMYMQARNVINYRVPKEKDREKKRQILSVREHRVLEGEVFQNQMYSTKNIQTWESE